MRTLTELIVLFSVTLLLAAGCSGLPEVRDNLNNQLDIYDLDPVDGETCGEVVGGFEGYAVALTPVLQQDLSGPPWLAIATSECRTFKAHVAAFNAACEEEPYTPDVRVVGRCDSIGEW